MREYGIAQDYNKALEFWRRGVGLASATAYCNIGNAYYCGKGVERDTKKAKDNSQLAAIGGNGQAGYNLGASELKAVALEGTNPGTFQEWARTKDYTQMPCNHIKHMWMRSRVIRGTKLLHLMTGIDIISCLYILMRGFAPPHCFIEIDFLYTNYVCSILYIRHSNYSISFDF